MKKEVRAFIFSSPARFAEVQIVDINDPEQVYRQYRCPEPKLVDRLHFEDEDFDYVRIILVGGPASYTEKLQGDIAEAYPEAEIKVVQ